MSELEKTFQKKSDQNIKKNQKIDVKKPHANKKYLCEMEIWFKQESRTRMNYEWIGKTI